MKIFSMVLTLVFAFTAFAAPESTPEQTSKPKDRMLACALLEAEGTPKMMEQALRITLEAQMKESPQLLPFRKAFETYLRRTISYEAQKDELADIYLATYTPDEIRELIRFYQTPIGRKKAAAGAKIAAAVAALTQKKMQENLPLFQKEMQDDIRNMPEAAKNNTK